ncbi:hypothetical protein D3C81_1676500 [compost metagenome]
MANEFEAGLVDIDQGAEGFVGRFVLGPGVNQRTLGAGEGQGIAVGFEQVLADFRTNAFDQVADVAQNRVVASHRVAALQQIEHADQAEHGGGQGERPEPFMVQERQAHQSEQDASGEKGVAAE